MHRLIKKGGKQYGDVTPPPMDDAVYLRLSDSVQDAVRDLMVDAALDAFPEGRLNAAPILQGAISGILEFALKGSMAEDDVRKVIADTVDQVLPQFVFFRDTGTTHFEGEA